MERLCLPAVGPAAWAPRDLVSPSEQWGFTVQAMQARVGNNTMNKLIQGKRHNIGGTVCLRARCYSAVITEGGGEIRRGEEKTFLLIDCDCFS